MAPTPPDGDHWTVPDDGRAWDHATAETNGVTLHTVTAGPEDGDLVVLLHGFPEFWYAWHHQIEPLAEAGYRVVAPDLRGYNCSEKPEGVRAYDIDELVADVVGLIDGISRDTAHVVGHDWGGLLAWYVAARGDVVDRLAILNAPHPSAYERALRSSPTQVAKSWYVFFFQLPILPEAAFRARDFRVIEEMLTDTAVRADAFSETDIRYYKTALGRPGALTAAVNYYRAMARRSARRLLTRAGAPELPVERPTLLLWGEQDRALDVSLTEGLDRWVSDLRIERFPDASHWVQFDAPERVTDSLLAHLAGGERTQ
ncbi:alpha/beta fold hydrolase [Haloarcula halophila]|uniref:alpha/beta fold hydrolase n=1 Tax=Haloarcula TaxID=2237 RepID=UPI0023E422F1|nr:alpha/beta fold hydrolase [Halomicroarcula sp. DFY41]